MKKYTRYIDRVTVKGSIRPIGFYTIDTDCNNLPVSKIQENITNFEKVTYFYFCIFLNFKVEKKKKKIF